MAMGKVRAMTRLDIRARLLRAMLPAALLLLTACNGAQQRVDDANRAYEAGDWDKAWNEATVALIRSGFRYGVAAAKLGCTVRELREIVAELSSTEHEGSRSSGEVA